VIECDCLFDTFDKDDDGDIYSRYVLLALLSADE